MITLVLSHYACQYSYLVCPIGMYFLKVFRVGCGSLFLHFLSLAQNSMKLWAKWHTQDVKYLSTFYPKNSNYRQHWQRSEGWYAWWILYCVLLKLTFIFLPFQLKMKETITLYPFLLHAFFMSIFASVIGPFGGFFASGFKRAFKIKVRMRN